MFGGKEGKAARKGVRAFQESGRPWKRIVFYAEDAASRVHFAPILAALAARKRRVTYLTSQMDDPVLAEQHEGFRAHFVGSGIGLTNLFLQMDADVLVMTMPDLHTYHIKRSKVHDVHYVYVFHSLVSTHMIYREAAFDHFDTILSVGPQHDAEIRAREALEGLPAKELVRTGYGRLDTILEESNRVPRPPSDGSTRVLVAPSWGDDGILETVGVELVGALLGAGFRVTVRPHPRTTRDRPDCLEALKDAHGDAFELETDVASAASLHASHIMISDWSGAAYEYAFGLGRPVLFIDVPRKVRNENWQQLGIAPIEDSLRRRVGDVVAPNDLARVPEAISRLTSDPAAFRDHIKRARAELVYNVGASGDAGAAAIVSLVKKVRARET